MTYFSSTKRLVAVRAPKGAGAKAEAEATRAKMVTNLYWRFKERGKVRRQCITTNYAFLIFLR
jgi:hypothetical protein